MLFAKLMVGADNRPFEQAPDAFNRIGMDITANPFLTTMVNAVVLGISKIYRLKSGRGISVNALCLGTDVLLQEMGHSRGVHALFDFQADWTATLDCSHDRRLVPDIAFTHALAAAAVPRIVVFDRALQWLGVNFFHGRADAVAEIPRGLIAANSQRALNLIRGDAFTGFAHKVDGEKPRFERQMRVVENRSSHNRKLVRAFHAFMLFLLSKPTDFARIAARAARAVRPPQPPQKLFAALVG